MGDNQNYQDQFYSTNPEVNQTADDAVARFEQAKEETGLSQPDIRYYAGHEFVGSKALHNLGEVDNRFVENKVDVIEQKERENELQAVAYVNAIGRYVIYIRRETLAA